ncbi:Fasciclin-domain-containing protein [Diplogelasinospora grovesii]|uniref:Fasciclin-domain-containing protein n=1 Tax=Diplogelasinospora grovesii TaxID=303347 RepID=A0AAN6N9J8_9PEZI|nr:Fasciclin-domain-containing protein [Diplogelasinospora grovesii]
MFGASTYTLPASLLALLAILPAGSAFSLRATKSQDLGAVLAANSNLSTYYNLVKQYPDILLQLPSYAGVTIVAPNNDAFTKYQNWDGQNQSMVTNILEYHILQGTVATGAVLEGPSTFASTLLTDTAWTNVTGGQKMIINKQPGDLVVFTSGEGSRSTVLQADISFTGGLLQVVDTLMVPPARLEPTARDAYRDLTSFLGALYAAGLVEEFAETPNVTIFAPRNAAFQRVAGTLEGLSRDELAQVMRYHMVPGAYLPSASLANGTNLTTAAAGGTPLHILRAGNNLYIDSAQMVQPDILVANGVVHMIDNVLNPAASAATPDPAIGTQAPVFPAASGGASGTGTAAPVPFTTALPCTADCPVTTAANGTAATGAAFTATGTGSVRTTASRGLGAAGPRCTGMAAAAVGVGVAGMGIAGLV